MSLLPFSSQLIADVGISFGDEGKGRLIPELAHELRDTSAPVSTVLKVNGGANSGHTAAGIKLNLLPAGVVEREIAHLAIGCGVVADPRKVWWEALPLEKKGYPTLARLLIDERALVSDLTHRLLDLAWEDYRTNILREEPRGSTGRGITPAFSDETGQWQITYADFLATPAVYRKKLSQRADRACRIIQHVCQISAATWDSFFEKLTAAELRANAEAIDLGIFTAAEFDFKRFKGPAPFTLNLDALADTCWHAGSSLARNIGEVRELILRELRAGHTIIGEFGQSYWLDKRHGFPPNVTASHTFTPEFFESAGIPLQRIHTFGVAKAYDTKVGTHTFITQMDDAHPLAIKLKKLEFGTSTGRQRMVGWFDAVEKGDALRYGGYQDLMINKADALAHEGDWRGDLLICAAYEDAAGKRYHHVPRNDAIRRTLRPVYTKHPGWAEDISRIRTFGALPENARRYIAAMYRATVAVAFHNDNDANNNNAAANNNNAAANDITSAANAAANDNTAITNAAVTSNASLPRIPAAALPNLPNFRYLGVGPEPSQLIKDIPPAAELLKIT